MDSADNNNTDRPIEQEAQAVIDPTDPVSADGGEDDSNTNDNTETPEEINDESLTDEDESSDMDSMRTRWDTFFPYPEPYNDQKDAIKTTKNTLRNDGFQMIEAACGTGKTLIALTSALELVRDPSTKYERVMCITSVKQQLRAFEDDMEAINANLPDDERSVKGLTLVGKADMCSWVDAGRIDPYDIYTKCDSLRDTVRNAISGKSERQKVGRLQGMVQDKQAGEDFPVSTDEWEAEYMDEQDPDDYCAFYAKYRLKKMLDENTLTLDGMMTPDDVMKQASNAGVCPHAALGDSIDRAEVIVANYYHAFDPLTIEAFTGELIGEETILVCDEAHMIVPKVRDLLSDGFSLRTVNRAIGEIEADVLEVDNSAASRVMKRVFSENRVTPEDVKEFQECCEAIRTWMEQQAVDALDNEDRNWQRKVEELDDRIEYPLRDPETAGEIDDFTKWAEAAGYAEFMDDAMRIGGVIAEAQRTASEEVSDFNSGETYTDSVGRALTLWKENDHREYFREVMLKRREREFRNADTKWRQHFTVNLKMQNCIPSEPIARQLNQFGGGILMSATLEPLDVYKQVVGLEDLEQKGRYVDKAVYGLSFPEENRESLAVDLPKFTYNNRSWAGAPEGVDTREQYAQTALDVVESTDGNVLICMPSYSEAEWMRDVLNGRWSIKGGSREQNNRVDDVNKEARQRVDKEILLDESSSNKETERLKEKFFRGDAKVLLTSLRGTLTEGVDYDGDKLKACLVVGVPIRSINGPYPKAIRTAYEERFGSDGFDFAFTVPAVRKSRQALGRVIRGTDEVGVRVLADTRYTSTGGWQSVKQYFPKYEQDEYQKTTQEYLMQGLNQFWSNQP